MDEQRLREMFERQPLHYIRESDGTVVPLGDSKEEVRRWAEWYEDPKNRKVRSDYIALPEGLELFLSTVFLSLDHGFYWAPEGEPYKPVLWETMVFIQHETPQRPRYGEGPGDWTDCYCRRYTSEAEAIAWHEKMRDHLHALAFSLVLPPSHEVVREWCDRWEAVEEEEETDDGTHAVGAHPAGQTTDA